MDKQKAVQKMTEVMAKFVGYTGGCIINYMLLEKHQTIF